MEEKTEKPTSRKLKRAKEGGDTPFSQELASSLILFSAAALLWFLAPLFAKRFKLSFSSIYSLIKEPKFEGSLHAVFSPLLLPTLMVLSALFLTAFLVHFLQKGWVWNPKLKRSSGAVFWLFVCLRVILIGFIAFVFFKKEIPAFSRYLSAPATPDLFFRKLGLLLLIAASGLVLIGFLDYFYQRWLHYKKLHMTHQEIKDERREEEGNSRIKSKSRNK